MRLGDKQEQRTCLSLYLLGNQMKISSFTASSCFLQATLQSRSWFRPEPFRRPCWSSKGRVRKNGHKNCYLIPPTPPLAHLGVWSNYFLPSELKRIYVGIRSQIIMNSITAPKKHSPIIQLYLIKSLSKQVMRITSVSEPTALAGSSKLQASTLIRWNEVKVNVYIHK